MSANASFLFASKSLKVWDISPAVEEQAAVFPGDTAYSYDLPSHHQLLAYGLRVLENLVLDDVADGDCELIALPLKLMRADVSPVRAILRELIPHPLPPPKGRGSYTPPGPAP